MFSFLNPSKKITKWAFLAWPENIRKQPQITHNEEAAHVIHIQCIVFKNNVNKIKEKYAGKLVTNVIS